MRALPAEDWSGPRLAALAGCSRSQLHRLCVNAFGRSPASQVWRVRMQEAEYWLGYTGLPLKLIADRLGYADAYQFSRAFKRWSGLAPAFYRAQNISYATPPNDPTASDE
ncbi:AraC family transcriptional regulator [Nostoc sp. NIES-2111]